MKTTAQLHHARQLTNQLQAGRPLIGTFVQMGSAESAEIAGYSGSQYVIMDMEHGMFDGENVYATCRAIEASGAAPIVRVPNHEPWRIGWVLDAGVSGILVPGIETADQARAVIDATRYRPSGNRGACPYVRAAEYAGVPWGEYTEAINADVHLWLTIESARGIASVEEILSLDGFNAVGVGVFDLAVSLGLEGDTRHPRVLEEVRRIGEIARNHGKVLKGAVITGYEPDDIASQVAQWVDLGAEIISVGNDRDYLSWLYRRSLEAAARGLEPSQS